MRLLILLLLCFAPVLLPAQMAILLDSEQDRFRAQTTRDTQTLDKLLADGLIYIHSNGLVEDKADFIGSVSSGGIRYERMIPREGRQVWRRGRTAVINGVVDVEGSYRGTAFDIALRYTSVYRKKKGRWQLMRWQSTKLD